MQVLHAIKNQYYHQAKQMLIFFFLPFWHSAFLCVPNRQPRPIEKLIFPALHAQHGPHWMKAHPPLVRENWPFPNAQNPFWEAEVSFHAKVEQRHWILTDFRPVQSWLLFHLTARKFCGTTIFLESWLLNPNFFQFSFNSTNEFLLCFKYLF